MKFKTILCDPPWNETGGGKRGGRRGADRHYPLMKTADILRMPVADVADAEGAHLYLWVTNTFLPDGLAVMKAWGFDYKNMITWGKCSEDASTGLYKPQNPGLGQYFRGLTEHCLFGTCGKVPYSVDPVTGKRRQRPTLLLAPRAEHSVKPDEIYKTVETVSPGAYLEIFGRPGDDNLFSGERAGWTTIGNQTTGRDVFDDLADLANDVPLPSVLWGGKL